MAGTDPDTHPNLNEVVFLQIPNAAGKNKNKT
jgi:hypothetical protein